MWGIDVNIGRDITERFKNKERTMGVQSDGEALSSRLVRGVVLTRTVEGTFMVLGTNFWPLAPQATDYSVPREILPTYERFVKFYGEAHKSVLLVPSSCDAN
jgi:cullin 1